MITKKIKLRHPINQRLYTEPLVIIDLAIWAALPTRHPRGSFVTAIVCETSCHAQPCPRLTGHTTPDYNLR
jgi:hypothetical protein